MSDRSMQRIVGMERRTVLRAGAVAWTVPAIAVVTAAPAFACSPAGSLTLSSFVANYRNHTNANSVVPTEIVVTSTIANGGTQPTTGYTRILTIPSDLFTSVSSTTPSGYSAPTITGGLAGWTLTYVRTTQLPAGGTDTFSATLTVGDTTAPAFYGWRGAAFTLAGQANGGTACGTVVAADTVEATPNATLTINDWVADYDNGGGGDDEDENENASTDLWIGDDDGSTYVRNNGRKAVGPVTLAVTVPVSGGRFSQVSPVAPSNVADGWEFVSRTGTDTVGPWTYTFRTTGDYLAPNELNGSSRNDRTPPFRARILLAGDSSGTPSSVRIDVVASAPGATPDTDDDNA
jgi:hypothetical protein